MLNSDPITLEKLQELAERLEPKTIFMNQKTYDLILQQIDFEPSNVIVINFIPDNQSIIINENQLKQMNTPFIKWF